MNRVGVRQRAAATTVRSHSLVVSWEIRRLLVLMLVHYAGIIDLANRVARVSFQFHHPVTAAAASRHTHHVNDTPRK